MEEDYWDGGDSSQPVKKVQNYDSYQNMFPELSWNNIKQIVDRNCNEKHERIVEILERERVRNTPSSGDDELSKQLLSLIGTPELGKSASSCQGVGSDYKTIKCEEGRCEDTRCSKFHSGMEKRRNQNSCRYGREPCAEVFRNGKWMDPSLCMKGDLCGNAHSRNEVDYYDESLSNASLSTFRGSSGYSNKIENQKDSMNRNPMIKLIQSAGPPKLNVPSFQEPSLKTPYSDPPSSYPSSSLSSPPTISPLHSNIPQKNVPKFNFASSLPPNPSKNPVSGPIITNFPSGHIPQLTHVSHSRPDILPTLHQFLGKNFLTGQNSEKLEIAMKLLKSKLEILQEELSESHHNQDSLRKEFSYLLSLSSCPLCSTTDRDGVYYCGHSLCKSCKTRYSTCPICN